MELLGGCHRTPASVLFSARLTWVQHYYIPHASQSEICTHFSDTKQVQPNIDVCVSCTVCYLLGGIFCRRPPRPLHDVHTKQHSGHREGPQEVNLQEQSHISKTCSMLHLGLILIADVGSMGCNVQSALQRHLNIPCPALGLICRPANSHYPLAMPNNVTQVVLDYFSMGGTLSRPVLRTSWAENVVTTR
jgi:hypothetical protein